MHCLEASQSFSSVPFQAWEFRCVLTDPSFWRAAFVIYDGDQKRVLVARDRQGAQDMHWGVTDDGRFMFGSEDIDLRECNPTATPFPAGVVSSSPCMQPQVIASPISVRQ